MDKARGRRRLLRRTALMALGFALVSSEVSAARPHPAATSFASVNRPLRIVAHRGGAAWAPENTLAAYRMAIARGDEAAECDVRVSRDGELVVIHDRKLHRTTNGSGAVARRNLKQLRHLDAGKRWRATKFAGQRLPRLAEVLDVTRDEMVLFVELKGGRKIVDKLAEELAQRPEQRDQIVIISFNPRLIRQASEKLPDVPRMLLRKRHQVTGKRVVALAERTGATMLGLDGRAAKSKIVRHAHARGLPVYAFTVNQETSARRLVSMGIDGLITDAPPRIAAVVDR